MQIIWIGTAGIMAIATATYASAVPERELFAKINASNRRQSRIAFESSPQSIDYVAPIPRFFAAIT
ncbi:hypothetical protein [Rosistilla oblonga]|uniref:hypothetical protein n=1 Tax=Rosistilla oblonga TaxID=2527990 RepID=UPI003A973568